MGLEDRDYMRERVKSRGGVFQPGTKHANPRRQTFLKAGIAGLLIGSIIAGVAIYKNSNKTEQISLKITESPIDAQNAQIPTDEQPTIMAPTMPTEQPQPFPESGSVQWFNPPAANQQLGLLRIMDTSAATGSKIVRIRDYNGIPIAQVYIRNEEGAQIQLPPGHYQLNIAIGETWYGTALGFGPQAAYLHSNQGAEVVIGTSDVRLLRPLDPGIPMQRINAESF